MFTKNVWWLEYPGSWRTLEALNGLAFIQEFIYMELGDEDESRGLHMFLHL